MVGGCSKWACVIGDKQLSRGIGVYGSGIDVVAADERLLLNMVENLRKRVLYGRKRVLWTGNVQKGSKICVGAQREFRGARKRVVAIENG
jgi:hypothetical protein